MSPTKLAAAALALLLASCNSQPASHASPSTPQETLDLLRQFERTQKFDNYATCFTPRGRAWLIGNIMNLLSLDAFVQPLDPARGAASQALLKKYDFAAFYTQLQTLQPNSLPDDIYARIDKTYGHRLPEILRDFLTAHPGSLFFPDQYELANSQIDGPSATLTLIDPATRANPNPIQLHIRFLKQNNHWLCDGEPSTSSTTPPSSTGSEK